MHFEINCTLLYVLRYDILRRNILWNNSLEVPILLPFFQLRTYTDVCYVIKIFQYHIFSFTSFMHFSPLFQIIKSSFTKIQYLSELCNIMWKISSNEIELDSMVRLLLGLICPFFIPILNEPYTIYKYQNARNRTSTFNDILFTQ